MISISGALQWVEDLKFGDTELKQVPYKLWHFVSWKNTRWVVGKLLVQIAFAVAASVILLIVGAVINIPVVAAKKTKYKILKSVGK